ncbi:hypothetical protein SMACR_03837 [Sordaria macrospora]|uniref:Amidohydrolase-related domain-containing protein n=1 Tax=Sordaria macrospora TaxID=5147 RepID=A0A8S9A6Q4_SORMA|nr:hypothetical protein SMACR_03837 [Sordaria macrospora]WPJ66513.1 hypothetical protein SMAC4_03837 [Sordaria macrospora]
MSSSSSPQGNGTNITKLTNCRLVINDSLVSSDLFISSQTGKILEPSSFTLVPDVTIDLQNRILSPGLIDCQVNGAFGFNFSSFTSSAEYKENIHTLNTKLICTGVTSYLPTLTSQTPELYHSVLPHLGPLDPTTISENPYYPRGSSIYEKTERSRNCIRAVIRRPGNGSESLGAHVEGPFLSPSQHGIHDLSVLRTTVSSWQDVEEVYGHANVSSLRRGGKIKMITLAPELSSTVSIIPELVEKGVVVSLGHTEASLSEASAAVRSGAKMITHLFNAMKPLHHRDPGLFGLLGLPEDQKKELFYGVIADGIHVHSTIVSLAYNLHPQGFVLVTDAMHLSGMPDGKYEWVNGGRKEWIEKKGSQLCIAEPPSPSLPPPSHPAPSRRSSTSSTSSTDSSHLAYLDRETRAEVEAERAAIKEITQMEKKDSILSPGCAAMCKAKAASLKAKYGRREKEMMGEPKKKGRQEEKETKEKKWGGIAGSSATLLECVNNLLLWTGMSIPKALASVTSTPAEMLGLESVKGSLQPGADADLVVFGEVDVEVEDLLGGSGSGKTKRKQLVVEEVWKFGVRVFVREGNGDGTAVAGASA